MIDINEEVEEVEEGAALWEGEDFARAWIQQQMLRRALAVDPS